jgi:diguanylate cyclase (GGDEF)-like protein/PAS domain S-box-containing protein
MFSSVLFRKIFFSVLIIILSFSLSIYFFSVPLIKRSVYGIEEASAKTILDNVYELIRSEYLSIEAYRNSALDAHKRQLKNISLLVESFLKVKYRKYQRGILTEEEAKTSALEELRSFRYGSNDYVWISDYDAVLLSHPDPRLHQADYSLVTDKYGKLIVPSVIKIAREKGEGYTSYWWRRLKKEDFIEKLAYSRNFPEWNWVIATGVYIDDVEKEVARRRKKMIEELRQTLRRVPVARTGYLYVFDSQMNMIIHPNPNIEHTNFSDMVNPLTGKSIGKELIRVAHTPDPILFYKWDKPDDKGRYIYEKISWVKYFKEFDWYIASSVYTEELNITSHMLRNRILIVSGVMFLLSLGGSCLFLNKLLIPIRELSDMAMKAKEGDLSVKCRVSGRQGDEIVMLATAFNSMITRLRNNIRDLDMKVSERTRALVRANEQIMQEMEERLHAEETVRSSRERDQSILESIEDGYFEVDAQGNLIFFNDSLYKNLGYTREELLGTNFREFADEINAKKIFRVFNETYRTGKPVTAFDWEFLKKDGSVCYVETSVSLITDASGKALGFRGIARDVTERKKFERELAYLAYHDSLTGLYNRQAFLEELKRTLIQAKHYEKERTILYIDLDRFKQVNDTYGHEAGDTLLKQVAARLKESVRDTDHVCRFGGDEFAVILNNLIGIEPEQIAQRIRENISKPYCVDGREIDFISSSIGISVYPRDGRDVDTLINCADTAMYKAKQERNQYVCYSRLADAQTS